MYRLHLQGEHRSLLVVAKGIDHHICSLELHSAARAEVALLFHCWSLAGSYEDPPRLVVNVQAVNCLKCMVTAFKRKSVDT